MSRGPTAVILSGFGGLPDESCALCHQVTTLDRGKFDDCIGQLSPDLLSAVESGIKLAMGMALLGV